jgi:putative aminopeptidase FrvX
MYVDIGAESKEAAEKLVSLGDIGCFDADIFEFGRMLKAKALDDRLGCAVCMKLLEQQPPCDTWFVFTCQEEVGARGAGTAAFRVKPDAALILEGTTAADLPGIPEHKTICKPGNGVVIPFMDKSTIYNHELHSRVTALADANGIKWQTKQMIAGGTDAGNIQRSRAGVPVVGLAAALRNIHSPASVGSIADFLRLGFALRLIGSCDIFALCDHSIVNSILVFIGKIKLFDLDHLNLNSVLFRIIVLLKLLDDLVGKGDDACILIDDRHAVICLLGIRSSI